MALIAASSASFFALPSYLTVGQGYDIGISWNGNQTREARRAAARNALNKQAVCDDGLGLLRLDRALVSCVGSEVTISLYVRTT